MKQDESLAKQIKRWCFTVGFFSLYLLFHENNLHFRAAEFRNMLFFFLAFLTEQEQTEFNTNSVYKKKINHQWPSTASLTVRHLQQWY